MALSQSLEDYPNCVTENVRFSETDMNGHVNNTVFSVYFEQGRSSYFNQVALFDQRDISMVIVKIDIEFLGMIYWPGSVQVGSKVAAIGNSSFAMEQILVQDGRLVGSAKSVTVLLDPKTNKSTPIPEDMRALLNI